MRIATWNVNSLKARQEAVELWLAKAEPDVLLIQETKLSDADAPVMPFRMLGYELVHHGEGRWNGVGILTRVGASDVVTNSATVRCAIPRRGGAVQVGEDDSTLRRGAMVRPWRRIRVVSLYAHQRPRGRSPFYEGKLRWFSGSRDGCGGASPDEPLVLGGYNNVTPAPEDVCPRRRPTAARTCRRRSGRRSPPRDWGLSNSTAPCGRSRPVPRGTTGGQLQSQRGMRSTSLRDRTPWSHAS